MHQCSFLPTAALLLLLRLVSATPLDDYVNKPDPTYTYTDLGHSFRGDDYTAYFINMTSQTWLSRKCIENNHMKCADVLIIWQCCSVG